MPLPGGCAGTALFVVTLAATTGALGVLSSLTSGVHRGAELAVLLVANLLVTGLRFVVLRASRSAA